jgi:hypothetical protein
MDAIKEIQMSSQDKLSRRKLLQSAAVGSGAIMAAGPQLALADAGTTGEVQKKKRPPNEFDEVLARCGSEFGNVTETSAGGE